MCSSPLPWFNFFSSLCPPYSDNVTARKKRFSSKFALAPYSCHQTLSMELTTWRLLAANWRIRAGRGSDGRDLPRLRSSPMVRPSDGPGPWLRMGLGPRAHDGLGRRAQASTLCALARSTSTVSPLPLKFLPNLEHFLPAPRAIGPCTQDTLLEE